VSESVAVVPAAGTPSTAVAPLAPMAPILADDEIRRLWRISAALAKSSMFKDVKQAEQAFAKVIIGRDLGLSPAQSMTGIYLVEGRPQLAAPLMGHFIRAHGYDYRLLKLDNTGCEIEFGRGPAPGRDPETAEFLPWPESIGVSTFTAEDAKEAGLSEKATYKKFPRNMYFSRCMSNGVKWLAPEVMGGIPVYAEGELEALPRAHDGEESGSAGETQESVAPTDLMAALEQAVDPNTERSVLEAALGAMVRSNALAPHSWTPSKVEMVFMGRGEQQVRQETDHIERANAELRARAAAEHEEAQDGETQAEGEGEPAQEGAEEPQDAEVVPDSADGEEAFAAAESDVVERSAEQEAKLVRIADLEDALTEGELTDQERADIDAELDSLRGELPPDVSPGQGELPV
jgi:hypothetical protein